MLLFTRLLHCDLMLNFTLWILHLLHDGLSCPCCQAGPLCWWFGCSPEGNLTFSCLAGWSTSMGVVVDVGALSVIPSSRMLVGRIPVAWA
ncbi:hypothetical protein Nepgr_003857 [Nepenthes gracilis]|uniref:Secreted protein n=1 Tax=Nepenthes gracilis TaxID=150966 RepID=A0AAD3S0A8_NEPGR|nr:hypothetical protein Nepgr_003857 [Nepenthes gracilis]